MKQGDERASALSAPEHGPGVSTWRALALRRLAFPAVWFTLLVVGLQILRRRRALLEPLVQYGYSGAEYLELIQLEHARALLSGDDGWTLIARAPDYLRLLDGEYPAGLHLLSVYWQRLAVPEVSLDLFPRGLNLVWLIALAVGMFRVMSRPEPCGSHPSGEGEREWLLGLLAVTGLLLSPAFLGVSHRYYYDLPMTALCTLAVAFLTGARGWEGILAGGFTGLALLIKWQSALYLAPAWLVALALGLWRLRTSGWKLLMGRLAGVCAAAGLVIPLLATPDALRRWQDGQLPWSGETSLGMALAQASGGSIAPGQGWKLGMLLSLVGPLGGLAWSLLLCGLLWCRRMGGCVPGRLAPAEHGSRWILLAACLSPLLWLLTRVRVADERFLLPLFPVLVLLGITEAGKVLPDWDVQPRAALPHPRRLAMWAGTALLVGLFCMQALAFEGLLRLPSTLQAPGSSAYRGWNPLGQAKESAPQRYLEASAARCAPLRPGAEVRIRSAPQDKDALHAWRWALMKVCSEAEILVNPGPETLLPGVGRVDVVGERLLTRP